jgi:hypothetical protein
MTSPVVEHHLRWSPWQPLDGCWHGTGVPNLPCLYRIRRIGRADLDYLGQTGTGTMTLRKRLAMLAGVYATDMPYRDPHTAAPALWALLQSTGAPFEVSVAPVTGSTLWRKGLEAVAIALYRQAHGASPTVSFGRMPAGYRRSSQYNLRLMAAGRCYRGGPTDLVDANHLPGVPPVGPLDGDPQALDWCGHAWSAWAPAARLDAPASALGLYRLRAPGVDGLLYIGQGAVRSRVLAHLRTAALATDAQGAVFRAAGAIQASWVVDDRWVAHQRLELENDLIAAHELRLGQPPPAQFLGQ